MEGEPAGDVEPRQPHGRSHGAHATTSSSSAANSRSSRVRSMKASSSDACCGDSSWSAIPAPAAASPTCSGVSPCTSSAPRSASANVTPGPVELRSEPLEFGGADDHDLLRGSRDEVVDARVGDQLAAADHDQVVGGERHLGHEVGGDEDRAALGGEPLEQVAHPVDALGVEAVDGLVEHDGLRVAEQRLGDAEPLAHAERELPAALARHLVQADEVDELRDAALRDPVGLGEREEMVVRRPPGVDGARLEQRADLVQRRHVLAVVAAVDGDVAARRCVEPEDQAHRRRLAGAVRPEEARDDARLHGEAEPVDGPLLAVVLREIARLDHSLERSRCG